MKPDKIEYKDACEVLIKNEKKIAEMIDAQYGELMSESFLN